MNMVVVFNSNYNCEFFQQIHFIITLNNNFLIDKVPLINPMCMHKCRKSLPYLMLCHLTFLLWKKANCFKLDFTNKQKFYNINEAILPQTPMYECAGFIISDRISTFHLVSPIVFSFRQTLSLGAYTLLVVQMHSSLSLQSLLVKRHSNKVFRSI